MLVVTAYGEILVSVDKLWVDAYADSASESEDIDLPLRVLSRGLHIVHERP
jgi:hypothetical protein